MTMASKEQSKTQTRNIVIFTAIALMVFFAFLLQTGILNLKPSNANNTLDIYVTALVTYTDGTTNTFTLPNIDSSAIPLMIVDPAGGNKSVSNVNFDIYATPVFTGTATSWMIIAPCYTMLLPPVRVGAIVPDVQHPLYQTATGAFVPSGIPLVSGTSTKVSSFSMAASTLQSLYTSWQTNTNYFWVVIFPDNLTMTITFADGSTGTLTAIMSTLPCWRFRWQGAGSFTSLSVSWVQTAP